MIDWPHIRLRCLCFVDPWKFVLYILRHICMHPLFKRFDHIIYTLIFYKSEIEMDAGCSRDCIFKPISHISTLDARNLDRRPQSDLRQIVKLFIRQQCFDSKICLYRSGRWSQWRSASPCRWPSRRRSGWRGRCRWRRARSRAARWGPLSWESRRPR